MNRNALIVLIVLVLLLGGGGYGWGAECGRPAYYSGTGLVLAVLVVLALYAAGVLG